MSGMFVLIAVVKMFFTLLYDFRFYYTVNLCLLLVCQTSNEWNQPFHFLTVTHTVCMYFCVYTDQCLIKCR